MVGIIYETITLEERISIHNYKKKILIGNNNINIIKTVTKIKRLIKKIARVLFLMNFSM